MARRSLTTPVRLTPIKVVFNKSAMPEFFALPMFEVGLTCLP
jgi:hypothetical protein